MLRRAIQMRISILFIFIVFIIITIPPMIAYGEIQRNDKYIPSDTYIIGNEQLLYQLSLLKELDDPIINRYITEINHSIHNGDYERAYELLNELNNYLKAEYGSNLGSNESLSKAVSFIDSIQNLTERGVEVNLTNYLYELGELLNNESLIQDALRLRRGEVVFNNFIAELINDIELYGGGVRENYGEAPFNSKEILGSGAERIPTNLFSLPRIEDPRSNVFNPPAIPTINIDKNINTMSYSIILYIVLGSLILAMLYYLRQPLRSYLDPLITKINEKTMLIKAKIRKNTLSPAVILYYKWYSIAKRYGYKRKPHETLRELLRKVENEELRNIGEKVTEIYEKNVYGKYEIANALLDKIERELNRLLINRSAERK